MEQKQLLIMRQYGIGVAEGAEASGYAKFEWAMRDCCVTFATKGLPILSGKYICSVLQGTQTVICGELRLSGSNGMGRFRINLPNRPAGVLAAAVIYTEDDLAYPVLLGHKGGGSAWQEETISGSCKLLGIRRANLFRDNAAPAAAESPKAEDSPREAANAQPVEAPLKEPLEFAEQSMSAEEPAVCECSEAETPTTNPEETLQPQQTSATYYEQNREHFEQLLQENEALQDLNELIPGSSWVLVHDPIQRDGQYVFGIVRDESDQPMFLCYGIGGTASQRPPQELSGYCQWVPKSLNEQEEGYWVIYQSAEDGKTYQGE